MRIGYALSSEEHAPAALVEHARLAEEAGFDFAMISDHFHPWIDRQGQSPFVWAVIGGIASTTQRIGLGTAVTCPLIRMHPAIVAHAAATAAAMMPGRFMLGVGTGENLNEHVTGEPWPPADVRLDMLAEAIMVIRLLWRGEQASHAGPYYAVQQARLYTIPESPPPLLVAATGPQAAALAARMGDGLIGVGPKSEPVEAFRQAGGKDKPCYGQIQMCWAESREEALRTATEFWPVSAIRGELSVELPLPRHFEQAAQMLRPEDVAASMTWGPDPADYAQAIERMAAAGYDNVYVHQVGPDQRGFLAFFASEVMPRVRAAARSA